jgi:hypothetical protein
VDYILEWWPPEVLRNRFLSTASKQRLAFSSQYRYLTCTVKKARLVYHLIMEMTLLHSDLRGLGTGSSLHVCYHMLLLCVYRHLVAWLCYSSSGARALSLSAEIISVSAGGLCHCVLGL